MHGIHPISLLSLAPIAAVCSMPRCVWQYPEKVVPKFVHLAMGGKPLPVHGDGRQRRRQGPLHGYSLVCGCKTLSYVRRTRSEFQQHP